MVESLLKLFSSERIRDVTSDGSPDRRPVQQSATEGLSPLLQQFVSLVKETLGPYFSRISENAKRSTALLGSISTLEDQAQQEILRALIVLTHAHLEDFLRTLAIAFLPSAGEKFLNDVPLVDVSATGRPEKFFLGKLVRHRGKKIDDLIQESVVQYFDHVSINSADDIARLLESVGFKVADHDARFPELGELMRRRHVIVHRADRIRDVNSREDVLQRVDAEQVRVWIGAVDDFINTLLAPIMTKKIPVEEILRRLGIETSPGTGG